MNKERGTTILLTIGFYSFPDNKNEKVEIHVNGSTIPDCIIENIGAYLRTFLLWIDNIGDVRRNATLNDVKIAIRFSLSVYNLVIKLLVQLFGNIKTYSLFFWQFYNFLL